MLSVFGQMTDFHNLPVLPDEGNFIKRIDNDRV